MRALIFRQPKFYKDFIQDFVDLMASLTVGFDCFLIDGDFNIHVCCESKPQVKEFLNHRFF